MSKRVALVAAIVAVVAGSAGCGDDDEPETIDSSQVEQRIEQDLSGATTQIASVVCPGGVKSETGATFTCTAKLADGGSAKVSVTQTQAPDDFSYSFKRGSVRLSGAAVDMALEQKLAANGIADATVDCPDPVKVKPGTVTCPISGAGGGVGVVSFEFTDEAGSIDEASIETSP